jgi:hypothetical protein
VQQDALPRSEHSTAQDEQDSTDTSDTCKRAGRTVGKPSQIMFCHSSRCQSHFTITRKQVAINKEMMSKQKKLLPQKRFGVVSSSQPPPLAAQPLIHRGGEVRRQGRGRSEWCMDVNQREEHTQSQRE